MPEQDPNETQADAEQAAPPPEEPATDAGSMAEEALAAANEALSNFDPDAPIEDTGEALMNEAMAEADDPMAAAMAEMASESAGGIDGFTPEAFDGIGSPRELPDGLDLLADVNLNVKIELGRTRMFVEDVLRLNEGSVVELDKLAGDPVDIYVNDRPVARGEVLVLNDNFCVRISEIIQRVEDDDETPAATSPDNGAAA